MLHIGFDARMAGVRQGGLGRYVEQVIMALGKLEEDFRVTLFVRPSNWGLFDNLDERFVKVRANIPWYGVREQVALPRIFKRARCDVYHVPHFNVPLGMPQPFVFTLHDLIMWEEGRGRDTTRSWFVSGMKAWSMKVAVRRALRRCEACIVPSQWTASRIQPVTAVKPERVEVIYEGADALSRFPRSPETIFARSRSRALAPYPSQKSLWFASEEDIESWQPFILTVGNAYKHKNIPVVIDAVAEIKDKFPNLYHVHAGPEHPRMVYEELVRYGRMKLGDGFNHVGNVSDETLVKLYQNAAVFIAPSRMEGFALPTLEAMSLGTPVIAARASSFPEILGEAALYVEAGDAQGLARVIEELLHNASLREQLSRAGNKHAAQFTWKEHARRVMALYYDVARVHHAKSTS